MYVLGKLRTGSFNEAIIYEPGAVEIKIGPEYVETVHAGSGLLLVYSGTEGIPTLAPVTCTTFGTRRTATSTLLDVLSTPFTTPRQLTLNGDGLKFIRERSEEINIVILDIMMPTPKGVDEAETNAGQDTGIWLLLKARAVIEKKTCRSSF